MTLILENGITVEVEIPPVVTVTVVHPSIPVFSIPALPGPRGPAGLDTGGYIDLAMTTHIQAPTPHPAYDDTPDLTLLFLNGLI